ncbi:hypothetical protein BGZ94_003332 [Podila epigama]|nr:hypothetical protein BGZ94_003332 [Podila epigama]
MEDEEFTCLAWTTLDHGAPDSSDIVNKDSNPASEQIQQSNILAAAGHLGSIKLINPLQNTCYRILSGHTDRVVRLKFSLTNPRWLFSASSDGSVRLWDIGSLEDADSNAGCLVKFEGLDGSPVTAIGVSEKYLIVGTDEGLMAQFDLSKVEEELKAGNSQSQPQQTGAASKGGRRSHSKGQVHIVTPVKIYPPSQEWHESAVDDIVYIPHFSAQSYRTLQEQSNDNSTSGSTLTDQGEVIFASRESHQGEILVWDATTSTETDAELKTILEWNIAESWTKFTVAENVAAHGGKKAIGSAKRQNILVAGSTDGEIVLYDLGKEPEREEDGNIVAEKPNKVITHPDSNELLRDITVSEDLTMIVAGDWTNRVLIWNYRDNVVRSDK